MAVAALVVSVLALLVAVAGTLVALRQASAADRSASAAQRSAELADRSATAAEESARAAAASDARDADRRADELAEREGRPRRRIVSLQASADLAMDSRYRNAALPPTWTSLPGGNATIGITNPGDEPLVVDRLRLICVQGDGPASDNYPDTPGRTVLPGQTLSRHLSYVTVWARVTDSGATELAESFVEIDITDPAGHHWSRDRAGQVTLIGPAP